MTWSSGPRGHTRRIPCRPPTCRSPIPSHRKGLPAGRTPGCWERKPHIPTAPTSGTAGSARHMFRLSRRSSSARRPSTPRPAPRWIPCRPDRARNTTPTPRHRTSTRSSSGRRHSPTAATARRSACPTPSGRPPGRPSPVRRRRSEERMTVGALAREGKSGRVGRIQSLLWRRPWMRAALLIGPGLTWFVVIYLASLVLMLITAFWQINPFTTAIERVWNLDNFRTLVTDGTYRLIILRTIGLAAAVTITDAVLAFPFAYYMARVASRRVQTALFAAVLLPLWASYLARVYAWILILNHDGVLNWSLLQLHLPPASIGYTNWAMWIVFSYIWLPFMIIPTYAALERIPQSYLEAAADLGARQGRATWDVILPLALPGIVAGSIFTFSLTLGDYVTPLLVGGAGSSFIGNVVYSNVGIAHNIPFAAALAIVPVAVMALYLLGARRLGAFEAM